MFPIKNSLKKVDALLPLLFNSVLDYAIRMVYVNQDGLKLNGTHQLLVYADDVNILDRSVHTIKKNTDVLVVASSESALDVNADKSKHIAMSRDQNAEGIHNIMIAIVPLKQWNT
jgi:hypothetical protein